MFTFEIKDMTCGHCVGTITSAVKQVDEDATVTADLQSHRVSITTASADEASLCASIIKAGYTPNSVPAELKPSAFPPAKSTGGCCCG